jgi:hypothetical protein
MKRHEQIHKRLNAEREFSCNKCGEKFNNQAPLKVHIETAHPAPSTSGVKRRSSTPQKLPKKRQRNDKNSSEGIYSVNITIYFPSLFVFISIYSIIYGIFLFFHSIAAYPGIEC